MPEGLMPFYTQTAILDRYIHARNPAEDSDALDIVLELLRNRPDLRAYFFQNRPSAAWAPILWKQGFFAAPPEPRQHSAVGAYYPRWDVQDYLISVATQAPDIVLNHVHTIEGPGWYISQAILALCAIPVETATDAVPRIITWLRDLLVARAISRNVFELVKRLSEAGKLAEALEVFKVLAAPEAPGVGDTRQDSFSRVEAVSKFERDWDGKGIVPDGITMLAPKAAAQVTTIMEAHLRSALVIEAQGEDLEAVLVRSWWRSAVEDTDQDRASSYKHVLLQGLRRQDRPVAGPARLASERPGQPGRHTPSLTAASKRSRDTSSRANISPAIRVTRRRSAFTEQGTHSVSTRPQSHRGPGLR